MLPLFLLYFVSEQNYERKHVFQFHKMRCAFLNFLASQFAFDKLLIISDLSKLFLFFAVFYFGFLLYFVFVSCDSCQIDVYQLQKVNAVFLLISQSNTVYLLNQNRGCL